MKIITLRPCDKLHIKVYGEGIELICKHVCDFYGVTIEQLRVKNKSEFNRIPRMFISGLCRDMFGRGCTNAVIGYYINRDHATVMSAVNRLQRELHERTALGRPMYPDLIREYNNLRAKIVFSLGKIYPDFNPNDRGEYRSTHCAMPKGLYDQVAKCAKDHGITISEFIKACAIKGIKNYENGISVL